MFEVGENVIYPQYGVCTITNVCQNPQDQSQGTVYILEHAKAGEAETIALKASELKKEKIRSLMSSDDVQRIYDILQESPNDLSEDRNDLYRKTQRIFKGSDIFKIAEYVRDLDALRDLIFPEMRDDLLNQGLETLIQEIRLSTRQSYNKVKHLIDDALLLYKETVGRMELSSV